MPIAFDKAQPYYGRMNDAIEQAAEACGGQAALARALGLKPPTVNQWVKGIRPVPVEQCIAIERQTHGAIRCEALRPDVDWGYLRGTPTHQKVA